MKITLLIILLILSSILPNSWLLFPIFVAYCFPLNYPKDLKKYLNIGFNILIVLLIMFLTLSLLSYFPSTNSKIMFYPKKYNLLEFLFYFPLSLFTLLVFKYIYKYKINWFDIILHILALLGINYCAEPLGVFLIKREHFRAFEMSLHLLFIFYSLYCIWKVNQHEKQKNVEII